MAVFGQSFALAFGTIHASQILHNKLLKSILHAPMLFFDTTPLGRIMNRFSKDVDVVDITIPMTIRMWFGTLSGIITTVFVICYSTPIFLAVLVPLGIMYFFIQV